AFQGDAADGDDGSAEALAGLLQQFQGGGRGAGLGPGVEETAEGNIAGAGGQRGFGIGQAGVAGGADDGFRPQLGTGFLQAAVFLTQMYTDSQLAGQCQIIVDQQLRAVLLAQGLELTGLVQAARTVVALVTVLQQAHATFEGGFDPGQQAAIGEQGAVGDGVEAAQAHWQKSSGRRRGTY